MMLDYSQTIVPEHYFCGKCGAIGCKLWRLYQTFLRGEDLRCAKCAAKSEGEDIADIDTDGRRAHPDFTGARSDQIGSYIPAVPTEDASTCWGYTSVPYIAIEWWKRLPNGCE